MSSKCVCVWSKRRGWSALAEPFVITRETLEHMDALHKLVAMAAIRDGRWVLVDDDQ